MNIPPRIELSPDGQAIPQVWLSELDSDEYYSLVEKFFSNQGKEELEQYTKTLAEILKLEDLKITLDEKEGLKNIKIGVSAGFDLDMEMGIRYVGHNIYSLDQAIPVFLIATKYLSML